MIAAVFFPLSGANTPELLSAAFDAYRAGMRLYTNGRQYALLRKALPGWKLEGGAA